MARYARKAQMFPGRYPTNGFGTIRTVREFDDAITAPCFGYRDAEEYYESAGAKRVVDQVRVPTLMITAEDDPFVPYVMFLAARVERNPAIRFVAPRHGGHCAYISHESGEERFWAEQRIVEFCGEIAGILAERFLQGDGEMFCEELGRAFYGDDHVIFAAHSEFAGDVDARLI